MGHEPADRPRHGQDSRGGLQAGTTNILVTINDSRAGAMVRTPASTHEHRYLAVSHEFGWRGIRIPVFRVRAEFDGTTKVPSKTAEAHRN